MRMAVRRRRDRWLVRSDRALRCSWGGSSRVRCNGEFAHVVAAERGDLVLTHGL